MFKGSRLVPFVSFFLFSLLIFSLAGCKGNSSTAPSNVGGGYTLVASGGTLNYGSGVNGLAVLVTLRDSSGNGPGAAGWQISISGPGINSPLVVSYDDGSPGSYMGWRWKELDPVSGTYTATATNGLTTLTYNFGVNATENLSQPVVNKSGNTISWNAITGAGSYYYQVTDGAGIQVMPPEYLATDPSFSTYSFQLPSVMSDGSYLVQVLAQTTNRIALQNDLSASPALASHDNISLSQIDFSVGGTGSGYSLDARGGVLNEGQYPVGTDNYGLVIWTSLLTNATSSTPPAGDWTVTVKGPGISNTSPITFTYPATFAQFAYWDYGTVPAAGTYTVTAISTGGTTTVQQTFTIPNTTSQLPVATGLSATPVSGGGANLSWDTVSGANSYYVNVWACIGSAPPNFSCPNGGTYQEIAGNWVNTTSAIIPTGTLSAGTVYDVYATACEQDMTDTTTVPPAAPGSQVDMSDMSYTYSSFTAQ